MIDEKKLIEDIIWKVREQIIASDEVGHNRPFCDKANVIECINNQPKIGEWIPCNAQLPENEQEVEITYVRKHYMTGEPLYMTARAFYEDGTLTVDGSAYDWAEYEYYDYGEGPDLYIAPKGWYEVVSFTEEFARIDETVIAWRPIGELHKPPTEELI